MKSVLILSVVLVAVESITLKDLRKKSDISRIETMAIFPSLLTFTGISDVIGKEYGATQGLDSKISQASTITDFLQKYNESFSKMESILTDSVYNYVVLQLWTYCTLVITKLDRLTQDTALPVGDLDAISFDKDHGYSIMNYLFSYNYNVDLLVHATFFFQSVKFVQSNNLVKQIKFQVNYFKENLKLKDKLDEPGEYNAQDLAKYTDDDLGKQLLSIKQSLSNVAKEFAKINSLSLITNKLIVDPEKIVDASDKIPPLKYVFDNEPVYLTYEYVNGSESQNHVITEWKIEQIMKSPKYLMDDYCKAVMSTTEYEKFFKPADKDQSAASTSSSSGSADTSSSAQSTPTTLTALRDSIKVKNNYLNTASYTNVTADVFLAQSLKDGFIMLGAIKSLFSDPCLNRRSRIDLTLHIVHEMRSQLVNFNFLYRDMKKFLLGKFPDLLKDPKVKDDVFLEKIDETLKLLTFPSEYTIDTVAANLCTPLMTTLNKMPNALFGQNYNKRKYMNYYFYNTVLTTYEKFRYSMKMFQM